MVLADRDADGFEQLAGTRFRGITVHFRKFDLEIGDPHALLIAHLGQRVEPFTLLQHFPEARIAHHHDVEHAVLLVRELVLRELPDARIGVGEHVARTGLQLSGQDFHERRLAAAIGTDQAIAMAIGEGRRDVLEQWFGAELDRQIGCRNQGGVPAGVN